MIRLTLGGYRATDPPVGGSRPFARERLYDEWIGLCLQVLEERVGFRFDIHANRFNGPGEELVADAGEEAELAAVRDALGQLWAQWTSPGGPGGPACLQCGREPCPYWPEACDG